MDEQLASKLHSVGLEPGSFGDPAQAWLKLHDRYGTRATLLDVLREQAGLTGVKGSMLRKVVVDKTRSSLEKALAAIKDTIEKTPASARQ